MSEGKGIRRADFKTKEWWLENCKDLFFFATTACSEAFQDKFHNFGEIHRRMCAFLDPRLSKSERKYMSVFRGSYKTTVLLAYFAWFFCWTIYKGKTNSIIYDTATKENTWNFSADLKQLLLQSEILKWIFDLPQQEKEYDVMTKNRIGHKNVRMDFASLDTTLVSRHYPVWVNDDLENDENSKTEYMREDLKRKWKYQKAILTKIKSKGIGMEIDVGTPYHVQGLTWHVRNIPSYDKLEIPCYIDGDREKGVTFPEIYTTDDFEEKRAEMGSSIFSAQYLLKPLSEEDALCPESWLRFWDYLPENKWRTMVIDPGGAEPGSGDPTGITIVDTDEAGTIYVVHADEYRLTPLKLLDLINNLKQQFNPHDIRIEKERFSTTIADTIQHRFPLLNVSFVQHKGRGKGDRKDQIGTRIWRLRQWFEAKRILVGRNQSTFIQQLLEFPSSKHDDILDSLAYQLDVRRIPKGKQKHYLPSGREFEPNIEKSFEEELDNLFHKRDDEGMVNDAIY